MLPNKLSKFVWHFLKKYKLQLVVFAFVALFWAIELSLSPYLLKLIIDGAGNTENIWTNAVLVPVGLYISMSVFTNINFRIYDIASVSLFPKIKEDIALALFSYLSGHSHNFFNKKLSGAISNQISKMLKAIEVIIQIPNEVFIPRILSILFAVFTLSKVSLVFSVILFVWCCLFVTVSYILSKKTEEYANKLAAANSELNGKIVDSVSNIVSAKIFANLEYEEEQINQASKKVSKRDRKLQWYLFKVNGTQGLIVTLLILAMVSGLLYGRMQNTITVGDFAFVLSLSISIVMTMFDFGKNVFKFSKEVGRCNQTLNSIVVPHEIVDKEDAKELNVSNGSIEFKDVVFSYPKKENIFDNLSIKIPAGQKVGLVGFSGGGKSTFIHLMLRLYDIDSGQILIDGNNITDVYKNSLRRSIAIIPQYTDLFNRTIMENIRYGNLDATDEEVIQASKMAHCHEFIMQMPKKYGSFVGERGVKLSGGQRQRIAIARAFLKKSQILILDEATSNLDSVTERDIQDSVNQMMQDKTTIVIAHRLSTLSKMDRILVFKDGKIVEDGTLVQLQKNNGYFSKLWNMQIGGFLPDEAEVEEEILETI